MLSVVMSNTSYTKWYTDTVVVLFLSILYCSSVLLSIVSFTQSHLVHLVPCGTFNLNCCTVSSLLILLLCVDLWHYIIKMRNMCHIQPYIYKYHYSVLLNRDMRVQWARYYVVYVLWKPVVLQTCILISSSRFISW